MTVPASDDHTQELLTWASKRGITLEEGVRIAHFPETGGRGLGSGDKAIPAGTVVIRVPYDAALSSKTSLKCSHLQSLLKDKEAKFATLPPEIILALHVLVEYNLGKESEYYDWIVTLPSSDDIGNAVTSPSKASTSDARRTAAYHVEHLTQILEEKVGPTVSAWATAGRLPLLNDDVHAYDMDRLRWALGIVLSRAHAVNVKSARDKQLVMLPVVDMLNHRFPDQTRESPEIEAVCGVRFEGNYFVITSAQAVEPGAQITISYGPKNNTELLAFYGFCASDNPYESMEVDVQLWKDGDPPEMVMAKQNFGLPYLQRLIARGHGQQVKAEQTSDDRMMQGSLRWMQRGEVDLSDELLFALRLGSANSLMDIGMAVGGKGLSPAGEALLRETLENTVAKLDQSLAETSCPVDRVWFEGQRSLAMAALAQYAAQ